MGNYYEVFYPPFFMATQYAYDATAVNSKSYERPDQDILKDFAKRLEQLTPLDLRGVKFSCDHQVILLNGTVQSPAIKRFLGNVADNILGSRSVVNELVVSRAGASVQEAVDLSVKLEEAVEITLEKPPRDGPLSR